jgi:hypothetical protein
VTDDIGVSGGVMAPRAAISADAAGIREEFSMRDEQASMQQIDLGNRVPGPFECRCGVAPVLSPMSR